MASELAAFFFDHWMGVTTVALIGLLVYIDHHVALQSFARPAQRARLREMEKQLGVRVASLRLSSGGHLVDLRYRVLDPTKAARLWERHCHLYLIDQATGKRLSAPAPPEAEEQRQPSERPIAGCAYFTLFSNLGKFVQPGSKVTVVVGDIHAANLVVEGG